MFNTQILAGSSGQGGETQQSLKFNSSESQYLSWTPAAAGNRRTWTWSGWVKRGNLGSAQYLYFCYGGTTDSTYGGIIITSDTLSLNGATNDFADVDGVFRDPSAWYHIVVALDTTQAVQTDRLKVFVNGQQRSYTTTAIFPSQNAELAINQASPHNISSRHAYNASYYFDGYLSDVYFIDGQALDASSFGQFTNGYWKAKDYAGSYGTNGFHLTFQDDVVSEGFNTVTYAGNGSTQSVSGLGFSPDLVWIKTRQAESHGLWNSVIGAPLNLSSNNTNAEASYTGVTSFDADGFSLGGAYAGYTESGKTYVAWCWDAGSGSPVSNTDGSITSSVKANPDYGFSIVSYTGNGADNATVGHGLNQTPDIVIMKNRSDARTWVVWGNGGGLTNVFTTPTSGLELNTSDAMASYTSVGTDLLATTFRHNDASFANNNSGDNYIAYCFNSVAGYSSIGTYAGNDSTSGPTVTTGFRPAFVMFKKTDGTGSWIIQDNTRSPVNPVDKFLYANESDAEYSGSREVDFLSDGFQIKSAAVNINQLNRNYLYMAFADTREAAFWKDVSGQGNHWTPNNLDYRDSVIDSPANNFATWNPLIKSYSSQSYTLQEGNLEVNDTSSGGGWGLSTIPLTSGKWYWEAEIESVGTTIGVGWTTIDNIAFGYNGCYANSDDVNDTTGSKVTDLTTYTVGDIIGIAADVDTGKIWFAKNGSWLASGNPFSGTNPVITFTAGSASSPTFCLNNASGTKGFIANFGQDSTFSGATTAGGNTDANNIGDFAYAPPSGYLALCTSNLPTPTIVDGSEYFNTVLWSGDGTSSRSFTGYNFAPDFLWAKQRSQAIGHALYDSVRGAGSNSELSSNSTAAEGGGNNDQFGYLSSFDSDGFTAVDGTSSPNYYFNENGQSFVGWGWKAGGTAVSNTDGTITSQVSANVDAGFSIVSYVGTGALATVGHSLGVKPSMMIIKNRDDSDGSAHWLVYHEALGATHRVKLDSTEASGATTVHFNNTEPTSSVFTVNTSNAGNGSGDDMIAYVFANTEGYLKAGSYTGNGSNDGPFIYLGFRPSLFLTKRTDNTSDWQLLDTARDTYNAANAYLKPNSSAVESTGGDHDFVSNGFKIRNSGGSQNASGGTYIYLAFAEHPFKYANAR